MVVSATRCYLCNVCVKEWAIEPEPGYRTWEEMGHDGPTEIDDDFVSCPFCGSDNVEKVD